MNGGRHGLSLRHLFPCTLLESAPPELGQERERGDPEGITVLDHLRKLPFLSWCQLLFWLSEHGRDMQAGSLCAHLCEFLTKGSPRTPTWSQGWESQHLLSLCNSEKPHLNAIYSSVSYQ